MAGIVYDVDALERARTVLAGEAGRLPAHGDALGTVDPRAFGRLDASGAMIRALGVLTRELVLDLGEGGRRLAAADRALDTAIEAVRAADRAGASSLSRGPG